MRKIRITLAIVVLLIFPISSSAENVKDVADGLRAYLDDHGIGFSTYPVYTGPRTPPKSVPMFTIDFTFGEDGIKLGKPGGTGGGSIFNRPMQTLDDFELFRHSGKN